MVIFIIVVLALLLAALAYVNSASNQNTAYQIASTRAYWAAQSGAEWGVYQVTSNNGSCASQTNLSYANTPNAGLAGCTATVACSSSPTASATFYQISSQGTCPAGNLGVANGALSATRSVIVGITASDGSGGNLPACVSCVENYCYYQLLLC
jgi:MSHA biogenesis protein MshP